MGEEEGQVYMVILCNLNINTIRQARSLVSFVKDERFKQKIDLLAGLCNQS